MKIMSNLPLGVVITIVICVALIVIMVLRRAMLVVLSRGRRRVYAAAMEEVDEMGGIEFEEWCATLLIDNGFINVTGTPASGDQGVDITAEKDDIKYAFQCKCYSSDLGNRPVQEVYAGRCMYDCHVGVVMSNSYFTSGAKALANKTGVLLWDREKLESMM